MLDGLITKALRATSGSAMTFLAVPRWRWLTGRALTTISYVGRRSGRTFSLPVVYGRRGDRVTVVVLWADAKTWWRNFLGAGAPLTVHLDGADHPGHAVAHRSDRRRVVVSIQLGRPDAEANARAVK